MKNKTVRNKTVRNKAELDMTSNAARNENMMRVGQNDAEFAAETAEAVLAKETNGKNKKNLTLR
ncbi:hypothetical protein [Aneurinibacillus tyrosinisolvens]|uniref:hypothetical protein n=1 Tax=Aneurinibacillus tyrosinisolvens TaxID=1443435 RepID=UPI00063ED995|nr:hypothetical protein [Aneurinibacillus tyrosinisolvens]